MKKFRFYILSDLDKRNKVINEIVIKDLDSIDMHYDEVSKAMYRIKLTVKDCLVFSSIEYPVGHSFYNSDEKQRPFLWDRKLNEYRVRCYLKKINKNEVNQINCYQNLINNNKAMLH